MKINFGRQISDHILKENNQLKNNLIFIKQQLQNFQENMIAFIKQKKVQIPITYSANQTLLLFIKTISSRQAEYQLQIKKQQVSKKWLKETNEQLQLKNQQLTKQREDYLKRQIKYKQEINVIEERYYLLARTNSQFQIRQQALKQEIRSIKQIVTIQKNIEDQNKKKIIQVNKLISHNQLLQIRERLQQENLALSNKYKIQIQQQQHRIKQLETLIQRLTTNIKLESSETNILYSVVEAFKFSKNSKSTIEDLRQQNQLMKRKLKHLEKDKLEIQSKLYKRNIELHNFQGQFKKQIIQKLQLQNKLTAKIKQIQRSQKDKNIMEQYYDKKWNNDYKKVKAQLQKSFIAKNQELQKVFTARVRQLEVKVVEWLQKVNFYENRNKQLQRINNLDADEKYYLRKEIQKINIQKKELNCQLGQTWKMSREQILGFNMRYLQRQQLYNQHIINLTKDLDRKQSNIQIQSEMIENKIQKINLKYQQQLKWQLENQNNNYQIQLEKVAKEYEAQITSLKNQIKQSAIKIKRVKQEASKQLQRQTLIIKQRHQKQLKQKEDQMHKKQQKTSYKLRDFQQKLVSTKKHHQEAIFLIEKQKTELQKYIQDLKNKLKNYELQLKLGSSDKAQIIGLNESLKKKISTLQQIIRNKNKQIFDIKEKQKKDQNIAQQLTKKRNQWLNQLIELQSSYQKQFQELKNIFNRQSNIYKSKIWELERRYQNQPLSKKNYQRIISLHQEKQQLKNALDIKEAENIVLNQINQMYEKKLRMSQTNITENQFKGPNAVFTRRIDQQRKFTQIKDLGFNKNNLESKDMLRMKKYIKQSYKKQYFSLAKTRYKQTSEFQRIKTNPV